MPRKFTKYIFSLMLIILIVIWAEIAKSPASNDTRLYFLNVGQGDSALIEKGDYQILIDGGPDESVLEEVSSSMPLTDRKIEVIILSHPHADHLVGINQILDRYEVGKIYFSGVVHTSNQYLEFLSKIRSKNIEAVVPAVNESFEPFVDSKLTFLWPGKLYQGQSSCSTDSTDSDQKIKTDSSSVCVENLNNTSEVVKFCSGNKCALFLGDLETDGQQQMFVNSASVDFQAQILKIAHHGSSNGTNQTTIDKIKPKYAIISVGADNKYGHPHAVTLDLLQKDGINTYRTDHTGHDATLKFQLSPTSISPPPDN